VISPLLSIELIEDILFIRYVIYTIVDPSSLTLPFYCVQGSSLVSRHLHLGRRLYGDLGDRLILAGTDG
jgi:hypothetical protein